MVFDMFLDTNSWRLIGADVTSLVVEGKNARRAVGEMTDASPETLDALKAIAKVNEQRSSDLFRAVFLGYVSVPIALMALLSDAAPDAMRSFISEFAAGIIVFIIGTVVFPIVYFCGNWRAKQIAWVIELYSAGAIAPLPDAKAQR